MDLTKREKEEDVLIESEVCENYDMKSAEDIV